MRKFPWFFAAILVLPPASWWWAAGAEPASGLRKQLQHDSNRSPCPGAGSSEGFSGRSGTQSARTEKTRPDRQSFHE